MSEIEMGDTVTDRYSGFTGVVVSKTEFINGCTQFGLVGKRTAKDSGQPEEYGFDSQSLKIVKRGARFKEKERERKEKEKEKPIFSESTGGPMRKSPVQRGF